MFPSTQVLALIPVLLLTPLLADSAPAAPPDAKPVRLMGVNLCGAEFGDKKLPGKYDTDYIYPSVESLNYYKSKGLLLIRLPFRWERIQQTLNGPLDQEELKRLDVFVQGAGKRGMKVIPDIHNYGRYHGKLVGSADVPNAAFKDLWQKLATHYRKEDAIFAYGLMNEPHDMKGLWPATAQAGVDGVRTADQTHAILVPGDGWSSAKDWRKNNEKLDIKDPAGKIVYEAHVYFDHDNSGAYKGSYEAEKAYPMIGVDRMKPFVEWLKEKQAHGFVGEFGVPADDPRWIEVLTNFTNYLDEVGLEGTYWAGGPWWGNYRLSIEPQKGKDRPQMKVMERWKKG